MNAFYTQAVFGHMLCLLDSFSVDMPVVQDIYLKSLLWK